MLMVSFVRLDGLRKVIIANGISGIEDIYSDTIQLKIKTKNGKIESIFEFSLH